MIDPDGIEEGSFRTKNIAPGITIILGKRSGEDKMVTQAYRFDKKKFTVKEARAWLRKEGKNPISFEAAHGVEEMSNEELKKHKGGK
jgi:hypothetical protein